MASSGFWATVELLTGAREGIAERHQLNPPHRRHSGDLFNDDIEDWLETMATRFKKQQERAKLKSASGSDSCRDALLLRATLVECDFSNPPVRSRLETLMGSNVVRLTDRRYMLALMARIKEDYEKRQDARIEERKKSELARTKAMILNRLIPVQDAPVEIRRYPLFQLYLYCDSIIEARDRQQPRSRRARLNRRARPGTEARAPDALHRKLYPEVKDPPESNDQDSEEVVYAKRIVTNGQERVIELTAEERATVERERKRPDDAEKGYILTRDEYDRLHYETEAIKDLRKAKTVEDMYAKAHEILGILYTYADEGRYDKVENEPIPTEGGEIVEGDTEGETTRNGGASSEEKRVE